MINILWDLNVERPTLGGALVLRQEAELIASIDNSDKILLNITGHKSVIDFVNRLVNEVFLTSSLTFDISYTKPKSNVWPFVQFSENDEFSYFSFTRILYLYEKYKILPRLSWNNEIIRKAKEHRAKLSNILVCVHLKNIHPFREDESNANGKMWGDFMRFFSNRENIGFLLLGDDDLPNGVLCKDLIWRAKDLGVDLATQLAIISQCNGFLGTASGICTAANFSATPHFIFKHPYHHVLEMQKELGEADRFSFSSENQRILRIPLTRVVLDAALNSILEK